MPTAAHPVRQVITALVLAAVVAVAAAGGWAFYRDHHSPLVTQADGIAGPSGAALAAGSCPSHDELVSWSVKVASAQDPMTGAIDWTQVHDVTVAAEAYLPPELRAGFEQFEKLQQQIVDQIGKGSPTPPNPADFDPAAAQAAQRWIQATCPEEWLTIFHSAPSRPGIAGH